MEAINDTLTAAVQGKSGEVRMDCPQCEGGQTGTLGVNSDTGFYQCFRCGQKGNLNNGQSKKKPLPEYLWDQAKSTFDHPYLTKKQVPSYGLRQDKHGNLVVPLYQYGQIATLQFIDPQGKKVLLKKEKGGQKKRSSYTIPGDIDSPKKVYVCEGYATTSTVRKVSGCTTIMAVDAGNLMPVVQSIKHQYPNHEWIMCADNDANGKGLEAARKAAALVSGKVTMPAKVGQDFNDLFVKQGLEAVQGQLGKFVKADNGPATIDDQTLKARAEQVLNAKTPCGPFDPSTLPEVIKSYIQEICELTQADPAIVTISVYGTISGIIGRKVYMGHGQYFQKLYPILWLLSISSSGSFKTTGTDKGSRIAQDIEAEIRRQVRKLREDISCLTGKRNEVERQAHDLKNNILNLEIQSPILPNRSTAEGLLDLFSWGQAGTIFLSEFGDWLGQMEQSYNNGLKTLFTDLFDCPRGRTFRTRTGGTIAVNRPFCSICAVSTLEWVRANIKPDDVGSGFFARFLIFYPPQKDEIPPALPPYRPQDDRTTENKIRDILNDIKPDTNMTLSAEATGLFQTIHDNLYTGMSTQNEKTRRILQPYLKRWSPYILKLAMINQLFLDPGNTKISTQAIQGAVSIVEYAIKSTTHLFENELGESEHQTKCRKILEFLARRNGKAKRKDILSSRTLDGGVNDYEYILTSLEESGEIASDQSSPLKNEWIYKLKAKS